MLQDPCLSLRLAPGAERSSLVAVPSGLARLVAGAKCWLEAGLGFFYPENCQVCQDERAGRAAGYVGARCSGEVQVIRPPLCAKCGLPFAGEVTTRFECSNCREMALDFGWARAAVAARGVVLDVIHQYKYRRALWFEPFLAGLLVRGAAAELRRDHWDMIVPVPLHPLKQRHREYNQAERLGVHLSRATGIPFNARLVRRVKCTRTQTELTRAQRGDNVRGAFALCRRARVGGARIILVDDVLTTGATASACARALKLAGADEVCVWTVARGL